MEPGRLKWDPQKDIYFMQKDLEYGSLPARKCFAPGGTWQVTTAGLVYLEKTVSGRDSLVMIPWGQITRLEQAR